MTAILATFVTVKTMADMTPRVTLDLQCNLTDFAAMGIAQGAQYGLVRLTNEAANKALQPEPEPVKPKGGELAKWAGQRCEEPLFWEWINQSDMVLTPVASKDDAASFVRLICRVPSRAHLDSDSVAAQRFHEFIREPFRQWQIAVKQS